MERPKPGLHKPFQKERGSYTLHQHVPDQMAETGPWISDSWVARPPDFLEGLGLCRLVVGWACIWASRRQEVCAILSSTEGILAWR